MTDYSVQKNDSNYATIRKPSLRRPLFLVLVLVLMLFSVCASAAARMPDFTVQTLDGSFTLSEALEDHKAVLINFFATWCGPCKMEFPFMQEAYEAYADDVVVIALSIEPTDTSSVLASYAEELGLTFYVGSDTETDLYSLFGSGSIPVTLVVDRFGNVSLTSVGARTSAQDFLNLFDFFTWDGYTETVELTSFPLGRVDTEGASAQTLHQVLGTEGDTLTFANPESPFTWPLQTAQEDDRLYMRSVMPDSLTARSELSVVFSSSTDAALSFDVCTETTDGVNPVLVYLDGAEMAAFGGHTDWVSFALPVPEGEHTVSFAFTRNLLRQEGEWFGLDNFRLLSGDEASTALSANPVWPVSDHYGVTPLGEGSVPLTAQDPQDILSYLFGDTSFALVAQLEVQLGISVPDEMAAKYTERFRWPEAFARTLDGRVVWISTKPGTHPVILS